MALAVAVAVPVAVEGGFTSASQTLLIGLSLVALALAVECDERPFAGLARAPALGALLALAALAVASAAWTVGDISEALRSGLVIAALAAVAAVAAWVTRVHGIAWVAGLIALVAVAEALAGMASAALREEPWAQRIGGSWRPGGTFEYPPALAVLCVGALPALGAAMLHGPHRLALAGAAGAALAGAAIGTADSRIAVALLIVLVALALAVARRPLGLAPGRVALAAGIPLAAAAIAHLALGGYAAPGDDGGAGRGLAVIAGLIILAPLAWASVLRLTSPYPRWASAVRGRTRVAIALGAALALGGLAAFAGADSAPGVEPRSGFDHGRSDEWRVAIDAALERPLAGAGAGAYAVAAAGEGGGDTLFAHNLALESWAELGPLGLLAVLGLLGSVAVLAWRLRGDPRAWLVAPAATTFLLANLLDWSWHLAGAAALWAVALGGLIALDPRRRRG